MRGRSKSAFVLGMGQLGEVFADALRATDYDVVELRRGDDVAALAEKRALPDLVMVTVGEDDLVPALESLPPAHRARAVLVQNELVPSTWERTGLVDPTVAVVWFERKGGAPPRVILPTRVAGPHAVPVVEALDRADLAADAIARSELATELVAKNAYILVTNVAGLEGCERAGDLLDGKAYLRDRLLAEVVMVQSALVNAPFDVADVRDRVLEALHADESHKNAGRTALARATRLLAHADQHRVDVPTVRAIVGRKTS